MFKLFDISGHTVRPTPESLRIEVFADLWERDTTEKKTEAMKDFTYVCFMCDPTKSNPFYGYNEKDDRLKRIKQYAVGMKEYEPDDLVLKAEDFYNELLEEAIPSLSMYKAAMRAKAELERFLNYVDLDERDLKTGKPIHDFKKLQDALKGTKDAAVSLKALRDNVYEEAYESSKIRGSDSGPSEFET